MRFFILLLISIVYAKQCAIIENDNTFTWMCNNKMFCGDEKFTCCYIEAIPGNGVIDTIKKCTVI